MALFLEVIKVIYQTTCAFINDHLIDRASALTYSTVLSIVPMLAVVVGIAKGFGLQNFVRDTLLESLPGQGEQLEQIFLYVENYLGQVQGGLFIGLGMAILFYTVLMLATSVEDAFNSIWQAPRARPWSRRIFFYLGFLLLLPLIVTSLGLLSVVMTSLKASFASGGLVLPFALDQLIRLTPFLLSVLIYTLLYTFLPNVRVRLIPALISAVIAALGFQVFQSLYINGVIWISRYNAIYGSFALFPLSLLWLQLSWTITLYGVQMSYTIQNISSYAYGQASLRVSRRYSDFVALLVLSRMTVRFAQVGAEPYTLKTISSECRIPLRMAGQTLDLLQRVGLIIEIYYREDGESYYQPALDPQQLTIAQALEYIDRYGSEDFSIDRRGKYKRHWEAMLSTRDKSLDLISPEMLIRDL